MDIRVIALTGPARAGKDTIGRFLAAEHGFHRVALADGVRSAFADLSGPTWDMHKDLSDITVNFRQALQLLGTEARERANCKRLWVDLLLTKIIYAHDFHPAWRSRFVIPDVRFGYEATWLREQIERWGGLFELWRVTRPGAEPIAESGHASEQENLTIPADREFINGGTLASLSAAVHAAITGKTPAAVPILEPAEPSELLAAFDLFAETENTAQPAAQQASHAAAVATLQPAGEGEPPRDLDLEYEWWKAGRQLDDWAASRKRWMETAKKETLKEFASHDTPSSPVMAKLTGFGGSSLPRKSPDHACLSASSLDGGPRPVIEVATSPRSAQPVLYLSGPMSGIDDFNFEAFDKAAEKLRQKGFRVVNPADFGAKPGESWASALHRDLHLIGHTDILVRLPGWEHSRGASFEVSTAERLGKRVVDLADLLDIP